MLKTFGDAELATMAWPNKVIIEHSKGPFVNGPPDATPERSGAAPGKLDPAIFSTAFAEWQKANSLIPGLKNHLSWIQGKSGFVDHPILRQCAFSFYKTTWRKNLPALSGLQETNYQQLG